MPDYFGVATLDFPQAASAAEVRRLSGYKALFLVPKHYCQQHKSYALSLVNELAAVFTEVLPATPG